MGAFESGFAVKWGNVCKCDVVGAFESDNPIPSRNRDFALWGAVLRSELLVTFVSIDKSNPRAGSAADKAEPIYMEQEVDYMKVVQTERWKWGPQVPPTKPRFVFMRCKRLGSGRLRAPPVQCRGLFLWGTNRKDAAERSSANPTFPLDKWIKTDYNTQNVSRLTISFLTNITRRIANGKK